jgi:hypothetical protein
MGLQERTRLTNGTLEDLLTRLAKAHPMICRIRAEIFNKYHEKDPMLAYLFNYLGFLEVLNEDGTHFLEELEDSWDATSTKGKLGIMRKIQVRDQLNREIAEYQAQTRTQDLLITN